MPETFTAIYRETICALADRYRLPAIYPFRFFISSGGLLSYGMTRSICFGVRPPMLTEYYGARNRSNFQFNNQPSSS
jgi:hypothetical protein